MEDDFEAKIRIVRDWVEKYLKWKHADELSVKWLRLEPGILTLSIEDEKRGAEFTMHFDQGMIDGIATGDESVKEATLKKLQGFLGR